MTHWIAHLTGWNLGTVEAWWKSDRLYVGFRCNCGRLSGVHDVTDAPHRTRGGD